MPALIPAAVEALWAKLQQGQPRRYVLQPPAARHDMPASTASAATAALWQAPAWHAFTQAPWQAYRWHNVHTLLQTHLAVCRPARLFAACWQQVQSPWAQSLDFFMLAQLYHAGYDVTQAGHCYAQVGAFCVAFPYAPAAALQQFVSYEVQLQGALTQAINSRPNHATRRRLQLALQQDVPAAWRANATYQASLAYKHKLDGKFAAALQAYGKAQQLLSAPGSFVQVLGTYSREAMLGSVVLPGAQLHAALHTWQQTCDAYNSDFPQLQVALQAQLVPLGTRLDQLPTLQHAQQAGAAPVAALRYLYKASQMELRRMAALDASAQGVAAGYLVVQLGFTVQLPLREASLAQLLTPASMAQLGAGLAAQQSGYVQREVVQLLLAMLQPQSRRAEVVSALNTTLLPMLLERCEAQNWLSVRQTALSLLKNCLQQPQVPPGVDALTQWHSATLGQRQTLLELLQMHILTVDAAQLENFLTCESVAALAACLPRHLPQALRFAALKTLALGHIRIMQIADTERQQALFQQLHSSMQRVFATLPQCQNLTYALYEGGLEQEDDTHLSIMCLYLSRLLLLSQGPLQRRVFLQDTTRSKLRDLRQRTQDKHVQRVIDDFMASLAALVLRPTPVYATALPLALR